jgi:tetratricopeptide (TPR) repeat protein
VPYQADPPIAEADGAAPALPEDLDPRSLGSEVRGQLRALARGVAEQVSLRLVAAGELLDEDPETALAHALVARRLASRIPAVREAVGIAAYRAGEWQTAIGELRAYHRMSGRSTHLAVLADCERALGRPERAVDMYRAADREDLAADEAMELLIVAAGARADLGQREAAVAMLQVPELGSSEPWVARLRYAFADALLGVGRTEEARAWFARAAEADEDALTDAAERLLDLDGVLITDLDDDDITDLEDTEDTEGPEDTGSEEAEEAEEAGEQAREAGP